MQNGDGRMKILILSCNTGEGHNSAGWAVKEYLELQGHQVVMEDMMLLKGARTSKALVWVTGWEAGFLQIRESHRYIMPAVFWRGH